MNQEILELLFYAKLNLGLKDKDKIFCGNMLSEKLCQNEIDFSEKIDENLISTYDRPDAILNKIREYALNCNLATKDNIDNFLVSVMNIVCLRPSEVEENFWEIYKKDYQKALDYLYDYSEKSGYIQKTAIERNQYFVGKFQNEPSIEITINLSKPEKNNKDIAKLVNSVSTNYPKCMLCEENIGFSGNAKKPSRETLRTIDVTLNDEKWFMQYSPYVYYDEHCIVINKEHHNMQVTKDTFEKLFDFVDIFPSFFIGSNASLPIVGGSILNHEHYQGGRHLMPLHHSGNDVTYSYKDFDEVEISTLKWYNSSIRIKSKDRKKVCKIGNVILDTYKDFTDIENGIFATTGEIEHNAISPIARFENGYYILEIILRNNLTTEEYPDGVFHAHKEYHHIKSEGIGLIEAMGLFILPPKVKALMESDKSVTKEYVAIVCQNILKNTAVFKGTEKGKKGFKTFMQKCGFIEKV